MTKKDIKEIIKCAEKLNKIAKKYGITGNFGNVYIEAYNQLNKEKEAKNE